ncbi:MAG: TRAP transporter small permease [Chloroflexota bacterium]
MPETSEEQPSSESWLASAYRKLKAVYFGLIVISIGVIFIIMVVSSADVFGRYFLSRPVTGALEIIEYAMVIVFFPGLAYIQSKRGNLIVEVIHDKFPKKVQSAIETLGLLIGIFMFGLIVWQNTLSGLDYLHGSGASTLLHIPVWPFKFVIVVGAFFVGLEMLIQFIQRINPFKRSEEAGEHNV